VSAAAKLRRGVLRSLRRFHPDRDLVAAHVDVAFYLAANPDVAKAGVDPIEHFLSCGWREGRDPSRDFSVRQYLSANPDVAELGMNPLVHFLRIGRGEGRRGREDLGFRYDILSQLKPVAERVAHAQKQAAEVRASPAETLARALASARGALRDLHITFSHDDYTTSLGGVQLCLQREAAAVARAGRDHLHLYPATPWPVLRTSEASRIGVLVNGQPAGLHPADAIVQALRGRVVGGGFAIHSLLGHSVDETLAILSAAGLSRGVFWLHDFASLCAGFHLLRNDVEDCAAPPPTSPACGICAYGPWRARHLSEHARLFDALELTVASPSQPTLDLWRASASLPTAGEVVLPHARLIERGPAPVAEGPLKVGYPGFLATHKGWPVFAELVERFADDPRYAFHHFGNTPPAGLAAAFHPVSPGGPDAGAMQRAMAAAELDIALIWSLCRETFSFTAYEAVAAGAAVLTNPDSGNVAAFVAQGGHGEVLADEAALMAAFESGEVLRLARAVRRPNLYDLAFSQLTLDLTRSKIGP